MRSTSAGTLEAMAQFVPCLRALDPGSWRTVTVKGGVIVAWGKPTSTIRKVSCTAGLKSALLRPLFPFGRSRQTHDGLPISRMSAQVASCRTLFDERPAGNDRRACLSGAGRPSDHAGVFAKHRLTPISTFLISWMRGPDSAQACEPFLRRDHASACRSSRRAWMGRKYRLDHARTPGRFLHFQQHDDRWSPTYVADLVAAALRYPDAAILLCGSAVQRVPARSCTDSFAGRCHGTSSNLPEVMDHAAFPGLIRAGPGAHIGLVVKRL